MTVISAWWRSNMPFQGRRKWHIPMASHGVILSGRLNYYITRWRQEVSQFGEQKLETRCGRESQHSAESWASGWATLENEKDTTLMAIRVGVNMLQFCSVSKSLSHTTLSNKVRGIFFKEVFACLYYCVVMILYVYVYVLCVCIVNHGHGYWLTIQQTYTYITRM